MERMILGIGLIVAMQVGCAAQVEVGEQLAIAKIAPGMTGQDVDQVLGKPDRSASSDGFIRYRHYYAGLVVEFDEDMKVAGVESTNQIHCLNDWICPKTAWGEIKARLRRDDSVELDAKNLTLYGDSCWATAVQDNGKVKSVAIRCQP